ncbi:MAG: molybdenum cofactor guanylyltransferase [Nocardioidaceae bacterium]
MQVNDSFAAIVLAGGRGTRLGGIDKAALDVGGLALLDRTLSTVSGAEPVIVVGPPRLLPAGLRAAQEDPPGGGPVAAIAAGLREMEGYGADLIVVLACDMPLLTSAHVDRLVQAASTGSGDGAVYIDDQGRRQHLAAAYRAEPLRAALLATAPIENAAMRVVAKRLTLVEIQADPETTRDCDTWDDVTRSRDALEER